MKRWVFLEWFYPLYTAIRFRCKYTTIMKLLQYVIIFVQYTSLIIYICPPTDYFSDPSSLSIVQKWQSYAFCLMWLFGNHYFIFDGVVWVLYLIIALSFAVTMAYRVRKKKEVSTCTLYLVMFFQKFLSKVTSFVLFYRFSIVFYSIIKSYSIYLLISLIVSIIAIILNGIQIYLSAIFLDGTSLTFDGFLELYDGKTNVFAFIVQFILILSVPSSILIPIKELKGLLIFIMFVLQAFLFYFRVITLIHTSTIGVFLEMSPIFSLPIVLAVYIFVSSEFWATGVTVIVLYILFAITIFIISRFETYQCKKILSAMFGSSESEYPHFVPGNMVTVLRIAALEISDPSIFDRFLVLERKSGGRASHGLEVVRFLSIFPQRRAEMLELLETFKTNSPYNHFSIHLFKKTLKGIIGSSKLSHSFQADFFLYSYFIAYKKFWMARLERRPFLTLHYSFEVAYLYNECNSYLNSLIQRYPFDPIPYQRFGVFQLMAKCNYSKASEARDIADKLQTTRECMADPILKKMIRNYPRLLAITETNDETSTYSTQAEDIPDDNAEEAEVPKSEVTVASFAIKSERCIPLLPTLMAVTPVIFILLFVGLAYPIQTSIDSRISLIDDCISNVSKSLFSSASSISLPLEIDNNFSASYSSEDTCKEYLNIISGLAYEFPANTLDAEGLVNYSLSTAISSFRKSDAYSSCECLSSFLIIIKENVSSSVTGLLDDTSAVYSIVEELSDLISKRYGRNSLFIYGISISAAYVIISFSAIAIQLSSVFSGNQKLIKYLCSEERFNAAIRGDIFDAWECLRTYYPVNNRIFDLYYEIFSNYKTAPPAPIRANPATFDEEALKKAEEKMSEEHAFLLLRIFIPLIITICFFELVQIPLEMREDGQSSILSQMLAYWSPINISVHIMNAIFKTEFEGINVTSEVNILNKRLLDGALSSLYNSSICIDTQNASCYRPSAVIPTISSGGQSKIVTEVIPILATFVNLSLYKYIGSLSEEFSEIPISNGDSYIALSATISAIILAIGIKKTSDNIEAFNSIFHVPSSLLEDEKDVVKESFISSLPQEVLIVTAFTENNKIYSASPNARRLLNIDLWDMIGKDLDSVLPTASSSAVEIREVMGKRFRSFTSRTDPFIKVFMIEESKAVTTPHLSSDSSLALFIPPYFLELFQKQNICKFEFNRFGLVLIRLADGLGADSLLKIYGTIGNHLQKYFSVKALKSEGSILAFFTVENADPFIALFFIRDLLSIEGIQSNIFSAGFFYVKHATMEIKDGVEPYLDTGIYCYREMIVHLFELGLGTIMVETELLEMLLGSAKAYPPSMTFQSFFEMLQ